MSFLHAFHGIKHAALNERNFKIHLAAAAAAVLACVILQAETVHFYMVVYAVFFVLCMELVNTAVEALVDMYCGGSVNPFAKVAKDCCAAAVLLAAAQAVIVACYVAFSIIKRFAS